MSKPAFKHLHVLEQVAESLKSDVLDAACTYISDIHDENESLHEMLDTANEEQYWPERDECDYLIEVAEKLCRESPYRWQMDALDDLVDHLRDVRNKRRY